MKKIFSIILAGTLAFLMGSCSKEYGPVYNPDNTVAPVLGDITLAVDDSLRDGTVFGTLTFAAADFGVNAAVRYTLYADLTGNEFASQQAITNTSSTPDENGNITIEILAKDLNNALMSLSCEPLKAVSIDLRVLAEMMGATDAIEGASVVSEIKSIEVVPFNAEKTFPRVYVIGAYCGWNHANTLFLHSYAEDKENYVGVIDFGEGCEDYGFKITGGPNWDEGNWGTGDMTDATAEAKTITLWNDGGSGNISNYTSHRYYAFHFVKSSLTLNMVQGFDKVGIIGLNGDWENDIVMEQQRSNQVFYADIDVQAATEFKFRLNSDWAINWGGTIDALAAGAGNIPVEPGQYRVYLDLNDFAAPSARFSTADYGKDNGGSGGDQPGGDEPGDNPVETPENLWSVIGGFAASSWNTDVYMNEFPAGSGIWISTPIEFVEGDEYKIRFNNDWGTNRGQGAENNFLEHGVPSTCAPDGGNYKITAEQAGKQCIVYNSYNETMYLLGWGVVGSVAGSSWNADVPMIINADGNFEALNVQIDVECKIRWAGDWGADRGLNDGVSFEAGVPMSVKQGGANIKPAEAGVYDIIYNPADETMTFTKK